MSTNVVYVYAVHTATYLRHIANTVTTKRATTTAIVEITAIVTLLLTGPSNYRKLRMSANYIILIIIRK